MGVVYPYICIHRAKFDLDEAELFTLVSSTAAQSAFPLKQEQSTLAGALRDPLKSKTDPQQLILKSDEEELSQMPTQPHWAD